MCPALCTTTSRRPCSAMINSMDASADDCDCTSSSTARSEEHTSELQSLMRISYAVFCLKKKKIQKNAYTTAENEYHIVRTQILHTQTRQHNQRNKTYNR